MPGTGPDIDPLLNDISGYMSSLFQLAQAAGLAEMAATTQALRAQASAAVANLGEGCAGVFNDPSRNIGSVILQQALSYNGGDANYVNAFGNSGTLTLSQTGYVDPVSGKPFRGDMSVQQYVNPAAIAENGGGAAIYLNQAFYAQTPADQSVTLVHELLHVLSGGVAAAVWGSVTGLAFGTTTDPTAAATTSWAGTNVVTTDPWAYYSSDGVTKLESTRAEIDINVTVWNGLSTTQRAQDLIHELGHAFNILLGAGGSDFLYDRDDPGAQAANAKITQDCIKD